MTVAIKTQPIGVNVGIELGHGHQHQLQKHHHQPHFHCAQPQINESPKASINESNQLKSNVDGLDFGQEEAVPNIMSVEFMFEKIMDTVVKSNTEIEELRQECSDLWDANANLEKMVKEYESSRIDTKPGVESSSGSKASPASGSGGNSTLSTVPRMALRPKAMPTARMGVGMGAGRDIELNAGMQSLSLSNGSGIAVDRVGNGRRKSPLSQVI